MLIILRMLGLWYSNNWGEEEGGREKIDSKITRPFYFWY